MRRGSAVVILLISAALIASCGGANDPSSSPPAIANSALRITSANDSPVAPSRAPLRMSAAASAVEPHNLFDWAESRYPQFFPSHQSNQEWAPYVFRYYPETKAYLAVEGVFVRVLGPPFGPDIVTVGTLSQFVCDVFPESCIPPAANAGTAREVLVGSFVTLDGSASRDSNDAQLTFSWTGTARPMGSSAILFDGNTPHPTFLADVPGTYSASLVVNNGLVSSTPASVTITAKFANVAPVANAGGSRSVVAGTTVFLSGLASLDQNNDPISYQWTLSKPSGSNAVLLDPTSASPRFNADIGGIFVVTLVVSDGSLTSQPASITILATSASPLCCKRCTTGKPCGDSCISTTFTCHVGGGCACY